MKKVFNLLLIACIGIFIISSCKPAKRYSLVRLKTAEDTVSYYLGLYYGASWKQNSIDSIYNQGAFSKGINEAFYKDSLEITSYEIQMYLNEYFMEFQTRQLEIEYKDYIAENKAFLEENAKNDSINTTESGLQYKVLVEGNGDKPEPGSTVKVNYTGSTIDGVVFDTSLDENEPAEFNVSQVISGWSEAVQLMSVGSVYRVYIPENLAYGSNPPQGSGIQPFSTLIFEIELLEIVPE